MNLQVRLLARKCPEETQKKPCTIRYCATTVLLLLHYYGTATVLMYYQLLCQQPKKTQTPTPQNNYPEAKRNDPGHYSGGVRGVY